MLTTVFILYIEVFLFHVFFHILIQYCVLNLNHLTKEIFIR